MEPTLAERVDQTRRMRDIVARLTLLSYTSAARIDTETARQKPTGGDRPPGDPNPLHLEFWWRFISEPDFDKRELLICEAEDARIAVQKGPEEKPPGESDLERELRMLKAGEGYDLTWVAQAFKCGPRDVMRIRVKHKRDPSTGRPVEGITAAELAEQGFSARQISAILGEENCSAQKAQYYVNKVRLKDAA